MEKHTVIDLVPILKKRKCNCFDSCNLMIYGPWKQFDESDDESEEESMEKVSPSKIKIGGNGISPSEFRSKFRIDARKKKGKRKLNVSPKKVKADNGKKTRAEEKDRHEVIRLEIATISRDCKGECGKATCGNCYARNKPFESMKAVRKGLREERRNKKRQMRKKKMQGIVKQYFEEMFD